MKSAQNTCKRQKITAGTTASAKSAVRHNDETSVWLRVNERPRGMALRSAHILYKALTVPADAIVGTDGVLILCPRFEYLEHTALFSVAYFMVLLAALSAAWPV